MAFTSAGDFMDDVVLGLLFFLVLFLSMLLFVYLGSKFSIYQTAKYPGHLQPRNKIIEGAIFALMGLLIAFTFSGARERFDVRRTLVVEEANAIYTAFLRLDLLSEPVKQTVQNYLKQYLSIRLAIYKKMPHLSKAVLELKESERLQKIIWQMSAGDCKLQATSAACIVLLPALNRMFDAANTRYESTRIHPPPIILMTLVCLALLSAALSGYSILKESNWPLLHIFIYTALVAFTIFVIITLEYPNLGFIRINYFDNVLVDVANRMY